MIRPTPQSVLDNHMVHCSGKEDRSRGRGRGQGRGRSMGQLECDMCGHCCVTQEGLDLHRLSHTGQTPLRCPLAPCRRRFASSAALQEHHGKVHERDPAPDPGPAHEGEAAVRTILVVHQAPGPESSTPAAAAAVYHGDPSSLVLLHPSVSVVGEQDVQHTIEFIIEETV
ncbi:hypothetical protein JZ751_028234 [Albula glossodonta]|uniref:C2H2-type domain-containing protein n=1 Tax=Albula glossodonta TaxID=121402 RepID=A0A8T2NMW7_9TELE|nr:hypothetical protein JZ751_028234 [Albula glossodonta]